MNVAEDSLFLVFFAFRRWYSSSTDVLLGEFPFSDFSAQTVVLVPQILAIFPAILFTRPKQHYRIPYLVKSHSKLDSKFNNLYFRAVSDAAAGEYTSAIETLVTAISLIKQSKVAHDERCKILISSLQDTLHGIEAKSYMRRDRSRSRDRTHRSRPRRERSTSRYRERSRERERDRDRDGLVFYDVSLTCYLNSLNFRKYSSTDRYRERSRSRERGGGNSDHYRDDR